MEASYCKGSLMTISFNHTIIAAKDRQESAWFFTHMFGLPGPVEAGYFLGVELEHGVTLDFAQVEEGAEVASQHYAFLVSEDDFDGIYQRIQALKLDRSVTLETLTENLEREWLHQVMHDAAAQRLLDRAGLALTRDDKNIQLRCQLAKRGDRSTNLPAPEAD